MEELLNFTRALALHAQTFPLVADGIQLLDLVLRMRLAVVLLAVVGLGLAQVPTMTQSAQQEEARCPAGSFLRAEVRGSTRCVCPHTHVCSGCAEGCQVDPSPLKARCVKTFSPDCTDCTCTPGGQPSTVAPFSRLRPDPRHPAPRHQPQPPPTPTRPRASGCCSARADVGPPEGAVLPAADS